jgi:kumamolisin
MHTSLSRYRDQIDGREFYANDSAPSLPSSVASIVQAVHGLDNHTVRHSSAVPKACCAGTPYTPTQIRTGYNFTAAPLSGLTGAGQTMGLLELNTFTQSNVTTFDTTYSLSPPAPQALTVPGGAVSATNGGEVEVELDIEVMQGIAPAANIMVFEGPNSNAGVNNAYSCMADSQSLGSSPGSRCPNQVSGITAPANSTSWGLCEQDQGASETATLANVFQTAAATGHSFYAASGDFGTNDGCSVTPAVDSPASDPNVTGTGGTRLSLDASTNAWSNETAWPAEPKTNLGGGGGLSAVYPRPSWQVGPGVLNSFSNGNRQVPDVSLNSDPVTGVSIYTCSSSVGTTCTPGFFGVGGTSAGAPAWAAFTAIYNQYAASQLKPNLGFANPTLYLVNRCTTSPFHDIITGSNANNNPFSITSGWDYLTGLGSYDSASMASKLANLGTLCAVVSAGLSTVSANPNTVAADGSATSTVTVTLKDANSNPVSGKAVTLAKSAGPGTPVITGPVPATTGAMGHTAFTVKSSTNGTDTFQATDTTDGNLVINQTANVTFGPVSNTLSTVSANPGSVASDGVQSSTVTVTLKDANGNGVAGKAVSLAKSAGSGAPNTGAASGPSSGSGQVTFSVTSTTAGTDTFQATDTSDGNLVINQTTTITFTPGGYTLDGWGGIHSYGSAPAVGASGYWPGWDIARGIAVCPENHNHGYTLDGWGGIHPFGSPALPSVNTSYWQGWDIARGIVLTTCTGGTPSGYTLDGWGGIHQFGNATQVNASGYWQGWDIANAIAVCPGTNSGYTLDGWGGIHPFGPANLPNLSTAYWQGWDIARGIVLTSCSGTPAGYTLDGWGGIHAFGAATPATGGASWPGWDIARGITALSDGSGGYVLDGWGGIHPWKATSLPASLSPGAYWGWDIARGVASSS